MTGRVKVERADGLRPPHTEKSFRNLIKSTWNQIVFTILRLIWNQTDVRLVPNKSENGKYNLISGCFNKISRKKNSVCNFDLTLQFARIPTHCGRWWSVYRGWKVYRGGKCCLGHESFRGNASGNIHLGGGEPWGVWGGRIYRSPIKIDSISRLIQ